MSWIDEVADSFTITRREAVNMLGLRSTSTTLRSLAIEIPPQVIENVVARTGLSESQVTSMTAARYDRIGGGAQDGVGTAWFAASHSAACVDCVAESAGRWQLSWKLTYAVACVRHRRYLVGQCECGARLHRIIASSRTRMWCVKQRHTLSQGTDLVAEVTRLPAPKVRDEQLLEFQTRMDELAASAADDREQAYLRWSELDWAIRLAFEVGTPDLIADADPEVLDAFQQICERRAASANRPYPDSVLQQGSDLIDARRNRVLMATLVKVAAGLVFAEDRVRHAEWFCQVSRPDWDAVSPIVFDPSSQPWPRIRWTMQPDGLASVFQDCGMPRRSAGMQRLVLRQR